MHGKTQNANEALNAVIWSRLPKTTFVWRETIELGTFSAVIHFNYGRNGILNVLRHFGLHGTFSQEYSEKLDDSRVERMSRKSTDVAKKRRKTIRAKQKGFSDSLTEKEPIDSYSTGGY